MAQSELAMKDYGQALPVPRSPKSSALHRMGKSALRPERRFRNVHSRARRAEFYLKGRTVVSLTRAQSPIFRRVTARLRETSLQSSPTTICFPPEGSSGGGLPGACNLRVGRRFLFDVATRCRYRPRASRASEQPIHASFCA
jgi:hypothetical protein